MVYPCKKETAALITKRNKPHDREVTTSLSLSHPLDLHKVPQTDHSPRYFVTVGVVFFFTKPLS